MDDLHPKVALVQDGARGHYGLALALQQAGVLEVMFSDFFVRKGSLVEFLSPLMRSTSVGFLGRMADRRCPELDGTRVRTNLARRWKQSRRRRRFETGAEFSRWQSRDNGAWIGPQLRAPINILMGFVRNIDPDLCLLARNRGIRTVADQMISPALIEQREMRLQQERFPGWQEHDASELDESVEFEAASWPLLDVITCPSQYVADGLVSLSIEPARVRVVHYPIDEKAFGFIDRAGHTGPVRVGCVGQVGLRKGAPYFMEVAKRFPRKDVQFTLVGHSILTEKSLREVQNHAEVRAALRSQVPALLSSFDLIYFPTTCEGSAYALMEAMAMGLPVVTSPNSGTVARHEIEGFICPYDDLESATRYIERLVAEPELRLTMGRAARERYMQFGLNHYAEQLRLLCDKLLMDHASHAGMA